MRTSDVDLRPRSDVGWNMPVSCSVCCLLLLRERQNRISREIHLYKKNYIVLKSIITTLESSCIRCSILRSG